jgi:hypothetical protein
MMDPLGFAKVGMIEEPKAQRHATTYARAHGVCCMHGRHVPPIRGAGFRAFPRWAVAKRLRGSCELPTLGSRNDRNEGESVLGLAGLVGHRMGRARA